MKVPANTRRKRRMNWPWSIRRCASCGWGRPGSPRRFSPRWSKPRWGSDLVPAPAWPVAVPATSGGLWELRESRRPPAAAGRGLSRRRRGPRGAASRPRPTPPGRLLRLDLSARKIRIAVAHCAASPRWKSRGIGPLCPASPATTRRDHRHGIDQSLGQHQGVAVGRRCWPGAAAWARCSACRRNTCRCRTAPKPGSLRGKIDDFGNLEPEQKKNIRKGLKVMCREIQMGVAAAQRALQDAGLKPGGYDCDRTGRGLRLGLHPDRSARNSPTACGVAWRADQHFDFGRWAARRACPKSRRCGC